MIRKNIFAKSELKPVRASDQIYYILREAIMKADLKAGETLVISELTDALKVSRTPLRDAIQRLISEGWVKRQINGRVVVTEISLKQLKDFYAVRAVLEGLAAREAAVEIDNEDLKNIEKQFDEFSTIANSEEKGSKLAFSGEKFHSLIHKSAKNEVCKQLLDEINNQLARYRIYTASLPGRRKEAWAEHMKILKLIQEKKPAEAEFAMREHIMKAGKKYIEKIKERING